jgi:hypothetical protein
MGIWAPDKVGCGSMRLDAIFATSSSGPTALSSCFDLVHRGVNTLSKQTVAAHGYPPLASALRCPIEFSVHLA